MAEITIYACSGNAGYLNYAEIKEYDIANGPGVRMTLFVSGCRHHCKNCFNEIAWDFNYGNLFDETVEDALVEKLNSSVVRGLTLLGGEPLDPSNQPGVLKLLRKVKKQCPGKDVWCYTGYVWEKDVCGWMSEQCVSYLKRKALIDCKLATIMTDFAPHEQWLVGKEQVDYFFVSHEKMRQELINDNIPAEKVFATGIPISKRV